MYINEPNNDYYAIDAHPPMINANQATSIREQNKEKEDQIVYHGIFSFFRLLSLFLVLSIEHFEITIFLYNLIAFLIIIDSFTIANVLAMKVYLFFKRLLNPLTIEFPTVCIYVNYLCNTLHCTWFLYALYEITFDYYGLQLSLRKNSIMTYYIVILLMMCSVIFYECLFFLFFLVLLCPCLTYVYVSDFYEDYKRTKIALKVQETLTVDNYEDYVRKEKEKGKEPETMCVICTEEYKKKDKVIQLKCNDKHVLHEECIRQWIVKKAICPTCRFDLNEDYLRNHGDN